MVSHVLISDIHGCMGTFTRLLNQVAAKHPGARLIFLGDLVDRGPSSRAVVEFAMRNGIPTCKGNHEDLALAYSEHTRRGYKAHCAWYYDRDAWLYNGGDYALGNWPHYATDGSRCGNRLPDDVLNWMQGLPPYIVVDEVDDKGRKLLCSHSGYGLEADKDTRDGWLSALWGRHSIDDVPFPKDSLYRVFGHTQEKDPVITDDYAMIDTGAAYAARGLGTLTAFLWPTKAVVQQAFDESPVEAKFTVADGCIVG